MNRKRASHCLKEIEKRIASCNLRGFDTKKLRAAKDYYVSVINKALKEQGKCE